jgi:hypothetical protein
MIEIWDLQKVSKDDEIFKLEIRSSDFSEFDL